ncbi:SNF2 helicase associated domain-containing protein [Cohnella zeiphila]|uniref:DEAD/DEAH box helicase n=1 Tax=Cohnella zeiphila TaxID=2761120 RepID=A0A7X0VZ34_9BACL|nr:SNF2 helicase associated domain-containing protein [Cohnella zeiphila]MBB6733583.1 DEAD/DEAH box helicase [Cohnella zeiphila]
MQWTLGKIKTLCGRIAYERGLAYYRANKVAFTRYDKASSACEAIVSGKTEYRVTVAAASGDETSASCSCPSLRSYDSYCSHIAAVLLNLLDVQRFGSSLIRYADPALRERPDDRDTGELAMTDELLGWFGSAPTDEPLRSPALFDAREPLRAEWLCQAVVYGPQKYKMCIGVKLGTERLDSVPRMAEWLERASRGEAYPVSDSFSYDPRRQGLPPEDEAILRLLSEIARSERMFREASSLVPSPRDTAGSDRLLLVPPDGWRQLAPLLAEAAAVKLAHGGRVFAGFRLSDEAVPLHFDLDRDGTEGYRLDVRGLSAFTVLEEYGAALWEDKLLEVPEAASKRIAELKRRLPPEGDSHIRLSEWQLVAFAEQAVPSLRKLGTVRIAESVAERMIKTPLKAKLYLDRVKDRLLAALEFQYGDIFVNPLESADRHRGADRILMRDGEREQLILELMERGHPGRTESGYFWHHEEDEFEFLHRVVPELEKLLEVHATSAVKERLFVPESLPTIRIEWDQRTDWLDFRFELIGIPEKEIRGIVKAIADKRKYYKLPQGALMPLDGEELTELVRLTNELGVRGEAGLLTAGRLPLIRALPLLDEQERTDIVKLGPALRQLLDRLRNPDRSDEPVPAEWDRVLRDYQKYGYRWMKTLARYGFGGILADEMGLGKTVQTIAFLVSVLPQIREARQPALIVAPASLLYNWLGELRRFAPRLRAAVIAGTAAQRRLALADAGSLDTVIVSYPSLRQDNALYAERTFHTLILDEAQTIKNFATRTARAVKAIPARHRFALTGTPIENSLDELRSIFEAVFPGLLPGRRAFAEWPRETVAKRIRPFLLRRRKADVLTELPDKIETVLPSELFPEQKKLYAAHLAMLRQETLKHLNDEDGLRKNRLRILAGLTRLRQICCHPGLFVEGYQGGSAKFEQLLQTVEEGRNAGRRMLVFSQFTSMLDRIGRELGVRGVPFFYLDGSTPALERVEMSGRFNDGERDVFLISLKAGGTGLNLTGADTVILYDLWWNPAVERQAADRAHRIGQRNVVQVIRLVARGTLEEKMDELHRRKLDLVGEIVDAGHDGPASWTEADIRELLSLPDYVHEPLL